MKYQHNKPYKDFIDYPREDNEIVVYKGSDVLKFLIDDLAFVNKLTVGQAFQAAMNYYKKDWSDYESRIYFKDKKGNLTPEYIKACAFFTSAKNDFDKVNYCLRALGETTFILSPEAEADLAAQ